MMVILVDLILIEMAFTVLTNQLFKKIAVSVVTSYFSGANEINS